MRTSVGRPNVNVLLIGRETNVDAAPPPPSRLISRHVERVERVERLELEIDRAIEKIDAALPKIIQAAEESKLIGRSPSGEHSTAEIRRAKKAFTEMSEDSLLTSSGMDIHLPESEPESEPDLTPPPGYVRPKLKMPDVPLLAKRRLHFKTG